ncbi:hypothetical protein BMS3Abin11_00987 [bacterium BMS3Abin11]|nr:hypothetical protein BMS3Abin11_00987 [bacterium BMS3Abin11]
MKSPEKTLRTPAVNKFTSGLQAMIDYANLQQPPTND